METVLRLAYLIAQSMQELLGKELIALYLHGSAATSDFIPGQSDLDLIAVVQTLVSASEKAQLQAWFARQVLPPELAGIDFELLTQQAAAFPSQQPDWNMIIRVQRHQHSIAVLTPDVFDGYALLDLAMARERGYALMGPDPTMMIATLPRLWLLQACVAQMQRWLSWYVINDRSSAVLTACRAWYYLSNGLHATKSEAGLWARSQSSTYTSLIDAALAVRRGEIGKALKNDEVKAFCHYVSCSLEDAIDKS